jgi:hypothetical protein
MTFTPQNYQMMSASPHLTKARDAYLLHEHHDLRSLHCATISRNADKFLDLVLSKDHSLVLSLEECVHIKYVTSSLDLCITVQIG